MFTKLKEREERGFTIIEVLIVLAIAGLIMLIVFLAVPALERNAHNTSAKNDISGLLGGMNEYINNNNGTPPPVSAAGTQSGGTYYVGGTPAACATAGTNCATAKIGYYDAKNVSIVAATGANGAAVPALGSVTIVEGAICNASGTAGLTAGASTRNYVALYTLEGGANECQQGS